MQLGKTLIGAVIGAALGIGVLFAVYFLFGITHFSLAIAVAALTGLGVRALVSTSGHASYARGALTGIFALAAYVGGWLLVAEVAKAQAAAGPKRPAPVAAKNVEEEPKEEAAPGGEAAPVEVVQEIPQAPTGAAMPKAVTPGQSPLDYVWLAIAGLVAYELGRGTGAKPVVVGEETVTEVPESTHPDA